MHYRYKIETTNYFVKKRPYKEREEDSLDCSLFEKKTQPKVSEKKGATGQSFIQK